MYIWLYFFLLKILQIFVFVTLLACYLKVEENVSDIPIVFHNI